MFQVPLATSSTCLSVVAFWEAIMLYHNRPNIINRKLSAVSQALFYKVDFQCACIRHISEVFTKPAVLYETRRLKDLSKEYLNEDFVRNILECYDKELRLVKINEKQFQHVEQLGVFISVRVLLPRSNYDKCVEVVFLDKIKNFAYFLAVTEPNTRCIAPPFAYTIELTNSSNLRINVDSFEDADSAQAGWLADNLFPKLIKWAENYGRPSDDSVTSLRLVSAEKYCLKYKEVKDKYGKHLVEEWPKKASTNPQKYIFEELAIASYLICLWQNEPKSTLSFVDCGCGNGLLVYILNEEGYDGYGIDVRRRPTWDLYPSHIKLEVGTVTPASLFPNATWIIGNHSDELTPWIPVIALKSSSKTNFFVLPCCTYDFSGAKFIRTNTALSQYSNYLDYIKNICMKCAFDTDIDKLRIPSTRRTCLVGVRNEMTTEELNNIVDEVDVYVESRMPASFTARSDIEVVRNCTQLERDLVQRLVFACFRRLLETKNMVEKRDGTLWNKGGSMTLPALVESLDHSDLKRLKNECGGLQTLLRNHRYIFEMNSGSVSVRGPSKLDEATKKYRSKPCYLAKNHSDGCLLGDDECACYH